MTIALTNVTKEYHMGYAVTIVVIHERDIAAYAHRVTRVRDGLVGGDEPKAGVRTCSGKAYLLPSKG